MLKLLKPKSLRSTLSHEEAFIERYNDLLTWALRLTERDREAAEDLLHDAYIHFTLVQPDLSTINNLDGYLLSVLKNLYLSQIRSTLRSAHAPRSLVDFDSLRIGLKAEDLRTTTQIHEELRLICRYACARKETSKAGSVLILRFFRGYYPSELAQVLRTTREVIDTRLRLARHEARTYLENPEGLAFTAQASEPGPAQPTTRPDADIFAEISALILAARTGQCFSRDQLRELYSSKEGGIDCEALSHLASCPQCLDEVNRLLKLPLLAERNPFEKLGRSPRSKGGSGQGGNGGGAPGGGGSASEFVAESREQARETFEHRPQQLLFSANGFLLSSIGVDHERNEHSLNINLDEQISFIEVFSEQRVRMLLMGVEPPPAGLAEQTTQVGLSNGRSLKLTLSFSEHWPVLHSVYCDPVLAETPAPENASEPRQALPSLSAHEPEKSSWVRASFDTSSSLFASLLDKNFWLRPAAVTALVAVLIVSVVLMLRTRSLPALTAASLLQQSIAAEQTLAMKPDQVIHRTITLEERQVARTSVCDGCGELISRRKIEVWQSAAKGISARRLFDEKGALIAGDWRRTDGVQTLYSHAVRPQLRPAPKPGPGVTPALNFENAWQFLPSASDFQALTEGGDKVRLEERGSNYLLTYSREGAEGNGLVKVTLVLSSMDLHPSEQTLTVRQGGEVREFRMVEASLERRAPASVAPSVFEPDIELLNSDVTPKSNPANADAKENLTANPTSPVVATPALEVEVLDLLNQANAFLGEQLSVKRTPEGLLRVEGIVDSVQRKEEILRSLNPVANNPAVKIQVETVEEARLRQSRGKSSNSSVSIDRYDVDKSSMPVEAELRNYFARKGTPQGQLDEEVRRYSDRMLNRSLQALLHARAMKQIGERFSEADLRDLDAQARAKWHSLIAEHARAFQRETESLRSELEVVFAGAGSGEANGETAISNDGDLVRAIQRLFVLSSNNAEVVRRAFSISAEGATTSSIRSESFPKSLRESQKLAVAINAFQSRER